MTLRIVRAFLALFCATASAFTQRGLQRPFSLFQHRAFGRLTPPGKSNKMPDAPLPVQSEPSTMQVSINVGAASLVGIFAILLVMSQTQQEQGKTLVELGKMQQEQGKFGKTQQEQGKLGMTLKEQEKLLTQLDSKFSQIQADVTTFSKTITAVSTTVFATTYVLSNLPEEKGRGDAT